MKIEVPIEYKRYLDLLVSNKYGDSKMAVLKRLFESGLEGVMLDISMGAWEHPDMAPSLVDYLKSAKKIVYDIPNDIQNISAVERISEFFGLSLEHTRTVIFVMGLGNDGYCFLRYSVPKYNSDPEFRETVNEMPHDLGLESEQEIMSAVEENDF